MAAGNNKNQMHTRFRVSQLPRAVTKCGRASPQQRMLSPQRTLFHFDSLDLLNTHCFRLHVEHHTSQLQQMPLILEKQTNVKMKDRLDGVSVVSHLSG